MDAAGNSQADRLYSFYDKELSQENNYYRLKQIDLDGRFEYSRVIRIKNPLQAKPGITILTNPFSDYIDLEIGDGENGRGQFRIIDMTGKTLLRKNYELVQRTRLRINLNTTLLPYGIYTFECVINNRR